MIYWDRQTSAYDEWRTRGPDEREECDDDYDAEYERRLDALLESREADDDE